MRRNQVYVNIAIPIFFAVLGFGGALWGSHISSERTEVLWQKQEQLSQAKTILNKRVDLIERVSKLVNSAPKMKSYQSYVELQGYLAKEYIECEKLKNKKCISPASPKDVLEISVKRADLNAEFSSTVQLVSLYFYGGTKDKANELGSIKAWWKDGETGFRELINSMHNDLKNFDAE